mgnify:CR=1 FL=1
MTVLGPLGPLGLALCGHGLSPLASLKLWAFLYALLGWFDTFPCMILELIMFVTYPYLSPFECS